MTKFVFAASFVLPMLLFSLQVAVFASILWGMFVITVLSFLLARLQNERPLPIVAEHLGIAILVVVLSHLIGAWVGTSFG